MLSLITALLNAAVRNVRRLRFSVDLKKVSVYVLLMCAALFLCSCSKRADEPVLEPVRIEEDGAAGASAPQSLLTDKKTDAKRAAQESAPAEKEEDTVEGNTVPGRNEEKADSAVSGRNEDKADSAVPGEADPDGLLYSPAEERAGRAAVYKRLRACYTVSIGRRNRSVTIIQDEVDRVYAALTGDQCAITDIHVSPSEPGPA